MNAHETHNEDDELGDHLSQAINAVRVQPAPEDVGERVLDAAASCTAASLPVRGRMRWYPMVAADLAASLLLAVGLFAFHAVTKDGTIGTATTDDATGGQHDGLLAQQSHEDGDWSRSPLSRVAMEAEWFRSERVALSPDGKLLVRASGEIKMALSDDGRKLLVRASSEIIDLESGTRTPIDLGGAVYQVDNATYSRIGGMQLSPDGSRIALLVQLPHEEGFPSIGEHVIQLVEFPAGRVLCHFPAGESYELRVAFSPDGKQVVAGEPDKQILVHQWIVRRDATTGKP